MREQHLLGEGKQAASPRVVALSLDVVRSHVVTRARADAEGMPLQGTEGRYVEQHELTHLMA